MGMGFPIFARALARGLRPSLGCDIVSNNRGDLFAQMRLGLQAERARANQPALDALAMPEELTLGVRDVLRFATLGGAEALGMDSLVGSIEPGKAADLILLRTDRLHMAPLNDPVAAVVLHAGPADVDTVLVGGEVVKESGRLGERPGIGGASGWSRPRATGSSPRSSRAAACCPRPRWLVRGHHPGDRAEPRAPTRRSERRRRRRPSPRRRPRRAAPGTARAAPTGARGSPRRGPGRSSSWPSRTCTHSHWHGHLAATRCCLAVRRSPYT